MSRIVQQLMVYPPENLLLMASPTEYINTEISPAPLVKAWDGTGERAKVNPPNIIVLYATAQERCMQR